MPALATLLGFTRCSSPYGEAELEFPAIASLVARWEADQITPTDGHVATWPDASGHGRDLTAPSTGARPTYNATDPDFNGQPSVTFDGVNDTLRNLAMPEMGTAVTGIDVLKVAAPMPSFGKTFDFHKAALTADGPCNLCGFYGDQIYKLAIFGGASVASQSYSTEAAFVCRMVFTTDLCRHQVSGAVETTGQSSTLDGLSTVEHYMASNGGASGFVACTLAARFIFNAELSSGDLAALLTYIEGKYGVALEV